MRFIKVLSEDTQRMLRRIYKQSTHYRVRQRAHCVLLSAKGYTTTQLQDMFGVDRITIYHWFDAWEARHLCGLYERKGRGRPPKLSEEHYDDLRQWAKDFPKNINYIRVLLSEKYGIKVHKDTIKRALKVLHFAWHRIRRVVKGEPDPALYAQKQQALEALKQREARGEIDLRYFDASGFCLVPYVPYAWQEQGTTLTVPSDSHTKRLNVLGFLNRKNDLEVYTFEERIDTHTVIACFDDFCRGRTTPTVVVLDNASMHTSKAFLAKIPEWQSKQVEIFHLPAYAPELNIIEILWRFMKYEWIDLGAYKGWEHLVEYVESILKKVGIEYKINFS